MVRAGWAAVVAATLLAVSPAWADQAPADAQRQRPGLGPAASSATTAEAEQQANKTDESPWIHVVTQVDRLRAKYKGNGIKIAVIDQGMNYTHPALGGCLGPGCRFSSIKNLRENREKEGMKGHGNHGTSVAGLVAGFDAGTGFAGVAPNTTLLGYLVEENSNQSVGDGWREAKEGGAAHIIVSTINSGDDLSSARNQLAVNVSDIAATAGVPCVASMGNADKGNLFHGDNPGSGRGVTAVGSVSQAYRKAVCSSGNGSEPFDVFFESVDGPKWDKVQGLLHDLDRDYGPEHLHDAKLPDPEIRLTQPFALPSADNCTAEPGLSNNTTGNEQSSWTQDLVGRVVFIRVVADLNLRVGCSLANRTTNALRRGAKHILVSASVREAQEVDVLRAPGHHVTMGFVDWSTSQALDEALESAGGGPVSFRTEGAYDAGQLRLSQESSYGPTWDFDIKPTVVAPGGNVWAPGGKHGYSFVSGTSFAAPQVAGIMALVGQARGGNLDPATLNRLIMSTAKPLKHHVRDEFLSVAQQGAGLIQAWDAAHATTLVDPAALTFNDTNNRPPPIRLRITNTSGRQVSYELSNQAAVTLYSYNSESTELDKGEPVKALAGIKISNTSLAIGANQSADVVISATDPEGLEPQRLPVWSGWIRIKPLDGSADLTVPYLGAVAPKANHGNKLISHGPNQQPS